MLCPGDPLVAVLMAAAVATLTGIDPAGLTGAQQVDQLKGLERQAAWIAACQARVMAAMDHPTDRAPELVAGPGEREWTELEVAAALRLSPIAPGAGSSSPGNYAAGCPSPTPRWPPAGSASSMS